MRRPFAWAMVGAWLFSAAALGASVLGAQARPDSTAKAPVRDTAALRLAADSAAAAKTRDSLRNVRAQARIDSLVRAKAADTIKSPLAHFESPDQVEITDRLHFTRAQLLSSGALNLADLLDRVPGVTTVRTGWLAGIHTAAYNGDFKRIRIFFDGVERDAVESRNGGVLDYNDIPLFSLDEITIERVAGEVRVWLRGWSVRRTTPYTRVDVFTGDRNTNGFRAHFGRRFHNGFSLQFVGQQLATQTGQTSAFTTSGIATGAGDGSQQLFDLRLGWSRGKLTIDAQGTSSTRDRDPKSARLDSFPSIPAFKGVRREGYARIAYGDSLHGWFAQGLLGVVRARLDGIGATGGKVDTTPGIRDTVRAQTQQLMTVGYRAGWWHASLTDRIRPKAGSQYHAPAIRVGMGNDQYRLVAYGEKRALDSLAEFDISALAKLRPWFALVGSQSQRSYDAATGINTLASTRAEAAFKLGTLWFGGGVIRQSNSKFESPVLFQAPSSTISAVATNGLLGSVHGPLYKAIRLDVEAVHWSQAQYSRPLTSVRSEIALMTDWKSRFPKGQFSINFRVMHDMRSSVPFFWTTAGMVVPRLVVPAQVVSALLEIRIQSATLFYQYRNLTGTDYEQIPGILMPAGVQMYGMRWEFWN